MADLECRDCGDDSLDVPKSFAVDGSPCGVCGSKNTKVRCGAAFGPQIEKVEGQ